MKKNRILELDVLRALAFIFVVIQHTIGGFSYSKKASCTDVIILKLLYVMAKIGVPIFITITGMLLFYSYYNSFSVKNYYKKRFLYIFIPYVIWSALCLILLNHTERFNNFLMQIFSGNCCYHLWYMGMILRIYLFFPLILLFTKQIVKSNKFIKSSFFILYLIFYWWILKNSNIITSKIGKWIFKNPSTLQQKFINITPLTWSLYFVLGAYIIFNYEKFKKLLLKYKNFIFLMYLITFSYSYYLSIKDRIGNPLPFLKFNHAIYIVCCITSILFFYLISLYITKYANKIYNVLIFIGKYSFPAYLCHIIVIQYFVNVELLFISNKNYIIFPIVLCIFAIILSTLLCYFINYLPFSEYILGVKSKNYLFFKNSLQKFKYILNQNNRTKI